MKLRAMICAFLGFFCLMYLILNHLCNKMNGYRLIECKGLECKALNTLDIF